MHSKMYVKFTLETVTVTCVMCISPTVRQKISYCCDKSCTASTENKITTHMLFLAPSPVVLLTKHTATRNDNAEH